ncbi:MAG: TIGR00730 family Rossman fold protein [Bacteroidales bacterium]|nr:TIGR00730 family Rossman fold protein [Bacteroidales bacterium]
MKEKGITLFCASSDSVAPRLREAAAELGRLIAASGHPLITGAGKMGLMGAANDACLAAGGITIGVIPQFMVERGWHHRGLAQLLVTEDMHERKLTMAQLSMASIALPGGFGTFDELFEIITWRQLGLYNGNVVILNVDGYYDHLLEMIAHAVEEHIIPEDHTTSLYTVVTTPEEALKAALAKPTSLHLSSKFCGEQQFREG